jgi:peptidyl-prolyl cis-trans isomerase D
MLKFLRNKKTAKKIWIVLAVIIIPAFVFWGFGSALRSKEESGYVGKIFGSSISALEFADSMQAVKNSAIIRFGDKFDELQKYINLKSQAWDRLILLYEAKRRKISSSDREVIELIESYPFFQRKGIFDNRIYTEMLKYVFRTQPRAFEEETRENLIIQKLFKDITAKITVTDEQVKDEYKKLNEEISIEYIAANLTDISLAITPSEEEIASFYSKNKILFKQPTSFNIEYLTADSAETIKKASLQQRWKRNLKQTAQRLGLEAKETGLFAQSDSIPGIGWSPEIMQMVSTLKIGQALQPIYLDKKYYLIVLKERKNPYIPELEEIKDKAKETYVKVRSKEVAGKKIKRCLEELRSDYASGKQADFNKVAKENGLKQSATQYFKYGSYIEGVGSSDPFWVASIPLKNNEPSEIIDTSTGFFIFKVRSRKEPDYKKLEAEKEKFTRELLAQKKEEYFSQTLEELKRKVQLY